MQDSNFVNKRALFEYTEWNWEMRNLYNKYSLVPGLNHDLMKECPVYAMYTISEYLKRKRIEIEGDLNDAIDEVYLKAGRDPVMFREAHQVAETLRMDALKPIVDDYMVARTYFITAMHKPRMEYVKLVNERDVPEEVKTK